MTDYANTERHPSGGDGAAPKSRAQGSRRRTGGSRAGGSKRRRPPQQPGGGEHPIHAFGNGEEHQMEQDGPVEPLPAGVEVTACLSELKQKSIPELVELCEQVGAEKPPRNRKEDLVYSVINRYARAGETITSEGVLEILHNENYGFLRAIDSSYLASPDDIYVSPQQISRMHLRGGDTVKGSIRLPAPRTGERYFSLMEAESVNGEPAEQTQQRVPFEDLTPLFPDSLLKLELGSGSSEDLSARLIDLIAPIGKGQRGLIVSPPKAGKTILLQTIAHSITRNSPEVHLIVLLIDERPEEVTEMSRSVRGEVVASTFDEPPSRHVQVANMVIEKAKRMVEHKQDVVILLDSITRLARAYNTVQPSSGRVLTGGVDANALERPKRFFGAARNVEEGGSLTILATALIETGSKMDEVIFEEFKGTGNMEVNLDRRIAEKRVFPAINIRRSGTRREDLLMSEEELQQAWILRKILHEMEDLPAMEFIADKLRQTKTNEDFFNTMKKQ